MFDPAHADLHKCRRNEFQPTFAQSALREALKQDELSLPAPRTKGSEAAEAVPELKDATKNLPTGAETRPPLR